MLNGDQESYLIYGDYVYWLAFFVNWIQVRDIWAEGMNLRLEDVLRKTGLKAKPVGHFLD